MTEPEKTDLEKAEEAQAAFKQSMQDGHPWVPGSAFQNNSGLDLYIQAAFESWVHVKRVSEQVKPARRVSLTDTLEKD